jgi:hypothetical protein
MSKQSPYAAELPKLIAARKTIDEFEPDNYPLTVAAAEYPSPIGKQFRLEKDGTLQTSRCKRPPTGKVIRKTFQTFEQYARWRESLGSNVALFAGTWVPGVTDGEKLGYKSAGGTAATKEYLGFHEGAAVARVDMDSKGEDEVVSMQRHRPSPRLEDAPDILRGLAPYLEGVGLLCSDSSSSQLVAPDGTELTGAGGVRVEFAVSEGTAVPAILEDLDLRCWANGWGWAYVDKGGRIQFRSLVDLALARQAQLDYAAPSTDGCESRRRYVTIHGNVLCASDVPPTPDEIKTKAVEAMRFAANVLLPHRQDQRKKVREELAKKFGNAARAKFTSSSALNNVLVGGWEVLLDDKKVTAAELAIDGEGFDCMQGPDPLDEDYRGGDLVSMFFWNEGKRPGIFSFAHGGYWLHVRLDIEDAERLLREMDETPNLDRALRILALTEGKETQRALLLKAVAKAFKVPAKSIQADMKDLGITRAHRCSADADLDPLNAIAVVEVDYHQRLPLSVFPLLEEVSKQRRPVAHVSNLVAMMEGYGISYRYNVITKAMEFSAAGYSSNTDNAEEALYSLVVSLAHLNKMPTGDLLSHMVGLADKFQFNPVVDYLEALEWDGKDRFEALARETNSSNQKVTKVALWRWFLQSAAAADNGQIGCRMNPEAHPTFEYCLVLQGGQGRFKTKGAKQLLPAPLRRFYKESLILQTGNKDSRKQAVSCWIGELGELDATLSQKAISSIKGFMSSPFDEIRLPYRRTASNFARRSSYIGTVNEEAYLNDTTGNRRFLPIALSSMKIDWGEEEKNQLWAQTWKAYAEGEQWWPTTAEAALFEEQVVEHESASHIEELLRRKLRWKQAHLVQGRATISSIVERLFPNRTQPISTGDLKTAGAALLKVWRDHGAYEEGGVLWFDSDWGKQRVKVPGGKNRGYLCPAILDVDACDADPDQSEAVQPPLSVEDLI